MTTLSHLNPEQQKAVRATEGRVLILAGAGSGKTSVLSWRIGHLIHEKKVDPSAILGLTFTNKAAQEMRQRVANIVGGEVARQVWLTTFHSFCAKLLRREIHHLGYTPDFSLYDEQDVQRLFKQLVRAELEHEGELPALEKIFAKISFAKSRSHTSSILSEEKDPLVKKLFERLQTSMRAYNAVDFDSLLSLTVQLFLEHPDVLKRYQERFRYIHIDEYQDTNLIQYKLAELLSGGSHNLCVVGDDDQSIYGWRGAEVKNILEFQPDVTVKLEQNFRSTPTILKAAHAVISQNTERLGKELWSSKEAGEPITLFHAPTEIEEAQAVVERVIALHRDKGVPWGEIAILYRSNTQSRAFEVALMQGTWKRDEQWVRGIPFQVFGGTEFYERSEIKDLLAYLRAILNPLDEEALLRIINVPRRGISDQTLDLLTQANRKENCPLWSLLKQLPPALAEKLSERAKKGISSFVEILETAQERFSKSPLAEALLALIEKIDYKKAITEEVKSDKMRDFKWDNVSYCIDLLTQYEEKMHADGEAEEISLHHFLTNSLLARENHPKREKETKENRVNLMTFHSAKGLEFEYCFLVGLEEGLLPHEKSIHPRGIEEERRLFYVALTRAKRHLTLTMARNRKRMGKDLATQPSRFLFNIPQELLKVTSWKTNNTNA
ncbi:MAG: ATP-dependent helicase [Chlamydiales bacterium]